jgi:nicotinate-nucleotide adenylyltransferase
LPTPIGRPAIATKRKRAAPRHNPRCRLAPPRVGLLGGSFNPAHHGHLHISLLALKRLRLDAVWWLVSPQNPLKPSADMAAYEERLIEAERLVRHPLIRVSDIERRLGTLYTADTVAALRRRFSGTRFVWLIGADNLAQLPAWHRWQQIFHAVPIAVFDRPTYSFRALAGSAARCFGAGRLPARAAKTIAGARPPAWVFLHTRLDPASATAVRACRRGRRTTARAPAIEDER